MKLLVLLVSNLLVFRVGETGSDALEKLSALAPGGNRERAWGGLLLAAGLGGNWLRGVGAP